MKVIIDRIASACIQRGIDSRELARRGGLSIVVALQLRNGTPKDAYRVKHLESLGEILHVQPADLLKIVDPYEMGPVFPELPPARGAGGDDAVAQDNLLKRP